MKVFPAGSLQSHNRTRRTALLLLLLFVSATLSWLATGDRRPARAAIVLLSQGRPATASTSENASTTPNYAVDGNTATRWSSAFADPQWIQVDLGASYPLTRIVLSWEAAFGRSYQIQVSGGATGPWTTIYSTTSGDGGLDDFAVSGSGRYVRMNGTARGTAYGYSLWEFQIYGDNGAAATATRTRTNTVGSSACGAANVAQGRPATASTSENASTTPNYAVDGNTATRWSSAFADPQWLQVDLGSTQTICRVQLLWEAAYGRSYQIQVSGSASGPWTNIYATTTGDGGTDNLTGLSGSGRYVRMNGTARGTAYGYSLFELQIYTTGGGALPTATRTRTPTTGGTGPTPTSISSSTFWGDTSNIPAAQNVLTLKFLNRTNGKYPDSQVYWSFNGVTRSIAEAPYFDMPANSAGRMYFYLGSPTSQYTDFIEFTVGPDVFHGNTTRVDWFGIKLAMRLHAHNGYDVQVGEDLQTFQEDRAVTFQKFINEVPAEFDHLAQNWAPYRISAPGKMGDTAFTPSGIYANYYTSYAQSVGVNASVFDIMACAGSLANNAQLCAALNRHVAQLPLADQSNPANFYRAGPANYYAKFWHDHSIQKLAYGFPYDDYAEQSSFVSAIDPQYLLVAIGW